MNEAEFRDLLTRYREGRCTAEEKESLELWFDLSSGEAEWNWESYQQKQQLKQKMLHGIQGAIKSAEPHSVPIWRYIGAAASIFLLLFSGWYFYTSNKTGQAKQISYQQTAVAPGSNQAMLTLSDGSSVVVKETSKGLLAKDGSTEVIKNQRGELEYASSEKAEKPGGRNTLHVPRGGSFQVNLPDGTKVWLNSATTMTYPAANVGSERLVELHGEAYFEVSPDKKRPFKVISNGTEIKVTGTHFNVSAYQDDNHVTATLAEGQVVVSFNNQQKTLRPGQQSVSGSGSTLLVQEVDVESALAWKQGYFVFEDQDIAGIMKMVSRWYDVEVDYETALPTQRFGGTFSKSKGLDGLLNYLEQLSNIHFKKQGKKITMIK